MRINRSLIVTGLLLSVCFVGGCNKQTLINDQSSEYVEGTETQKEKDNRSVVKEERKTSLKDNSYLYENEDMSSVITMYLTVSKGNSSENTNHTWSEINSYSVYDYENMGVERYGVNAILQVGDENGPIAGELGYGRTIPNATVTIRGQSSSENPQKGYKIKLTENAGNWNNQTVINLNKHQMDGTRFRNKLMYKLLEDVPDLVSFQTQFVHLYVKDTTQSSESGFVDYGLYTQVEQANKGYLKRHGLDKNGQLYKLNMFEFFQYEDSIVLKSDSNYDEKRFEAILETKGSNDHSKLIAMLKDVNDFDLSTKEILEKWFDEDNLFSWLAFNILTGNIDTQSRNTLLYSPLNENVWYFINWDCDSALSNKELEAKETSIADGWEQGVSNYWGNVLYKRILKDGDLRRKLDDKILAIKEIITEEKVNTLVGQLKGVTQQYAYQLPDVENEPLTPAQYDEVCQAIPGEIQENYDKYLQSLEKPMPFFIGIPSRDEQGIHFIWDPSYDFQKEMITYSLEVADNLEFTNTIIAETNLATPQYDTNIRLESGQYFVRIKASDESGNSQYAFDYYVTNNSIKNFGVLSFYVMEDGSIQGETYG